MALFSWSMQIIKRSAGRSSVAASAYRSGERLRDFRTDTTHDYRRRSGVEHTEILLPADAPDWCRSIGREALWNRVEAGEKRKDAQVARELRIMIPRELSPDARLNTIRDYLTKAFVSKGMIADVAWHNTTASDGSEQPHAHVMLTMRPLTEEGFGPKSRHDWIEDPSGRTHPDGRPVMVVSNEDSWNCPAYFDRCREDWENIANTALAQAGTEARIDRRSLLARGLLRLPEPALRLAWYLKDLHGCMKDRFGHFQMARHYRAVEDAAKAAFARMETQPNRLGDRARMAHRFYDWIERQIDRLQPPPPPSRDPSFEPER
jgi:ATP-dependent exoDNAse (exonuclease V) alpha subunit